MNINLGSIKMPINAATKSFVILAKCGAGKSYTGAVMAEEFHKAGIPFVVFDPIDVWWGLRLDKDGKNKGLPIVVFGIEHADIKLDRDMGRKIAQAVVKENISCVISTFGMPKVAQRHLIAEFAEEILNINNTPRHIFIEEAHEFIPQRVFGGLGKTFNAVSNLVVMGRNRGLGVTIVNQRAATVNKDVLTQLDTLIALRSVGPQDRKALSEWVEAHEAEGDFDKFISSLPSLPTGEGWIWSPEFLGIFERIKIRKRDTFHPDREKIGDKFVMPQLDQADVEGFIAKFSEETALNDLDTKLFNAYVGPTKKEKNPIEKMANDQIVLTMKNEYESQLLQKDIEIRNLTGILESIRKILGVPQAHVPYEVSKLYPGTIEIWLPKLTTGEAKIFKFLASRAGMKFTWSQIGLGVGLSGKSGSFSGYISTLKSNNLIKETDGFFEIHPDL